MNNNELFDRMVQRLGVVWKSLHSQKEQGRMSAGAIEGVKTASVKLAAPRPLKGGLKVGKAAGMLRNKPLPIDTALDRFHDEWARRTSP